MWREHGTHKKFQTLQNITYTKPNKLSENKFTLKKKFLNQEMLGFEKSTTKNYPHKAKIILKKTKKGRI